MTARRLKQTNRQGRYAFRKSPFVRGVGDVLNIGPQTRYLEAAEQADTLSKSWATVGSYLFDAAVFLGTLARATQHVFDLKVTRGDKHTTGRVFEYKDPDTGADSFAAVYDVPQGVHVIGVSKVSNSSQSGQQGSGGATSRK